MFSAMVRRISSSCSTTAELRIYIVRQPLLVAGTILIVGGSLLNWKSSSIETKKKKTKIIDLYNNFCLPVAELGIISIATVRLSITGPVKTVMHTSILPAASDVVYRSCSNLICAVDGAHIHRVSMAKTKQKLTEVIIYDDNGGATEAEHSIRRLRVCERDSE